MLFLITCHIRTAYKYVLRPVPYGAIELCTRFDQGFDRSRIRGAVAIIRRIRTERPVRSLVCWGAGHGACPVLQRPQLLTTDHSHQVIPIAIITTGLRHTIVLLSFLTGLVSTSCSTRHWPKASSTTPTSNCQCGLQSKSYGPAVTFPADALLSTEPNKYGAISTSQVEDAA